MEYEILNKSQANQLRKQLREASTASDQAWIEQCRLLHTVYYSGYTDELKPIFELWGFESWHDYVEIELGLHVTTANAMLTVAQFFYVRCKDHWDGTIVSRQRMRALARAPQVTPENVNSWLQKSQDMTVCQLEHKLENKRVPTKKVTFNLAESDAELLSKALDDLMKTGEYGTRGEALLSLFKPRRARAA